MVRTDVDVPLLRFALLTLILPIVACDSRSRIPGTTRTTPPLTGPSPVGLPTMTLSGQVFELTHGSRLPAADFPLVGVVAPTAGGEWRFEETRTGADGRYVFAQLPRGTAVVLAASPAHRQVCGALAAPDTTTQLDVEVTSKANPQASPAPAPLRVTGQVYEMTSAGRIGRADIWIEIQWNADSPLLLVSTDASGRYEACGIPAGRPVLFDILAGASYDVVNHPVVWRRFTSDTAVDFELRHID